MPYYLNEHKKTKRPTNAPPAPTPHPNNDFDNDFEVIAIIRANYLRMGQIELTRLIVDKFEGKQIEIGIRVIK